MNIMTYDIVGYRGRTLWYSTVICTLVIYSEQIGFKFSLPEKLATHKSKFSITVIIHIDKLHFYMRNHVIFANIQPLLEYNIVS